MREDFGQTKSIFKYLKIDFFFLIWGKMFKSFEIKIIEP